MKNNILLLCIKNQIEKFDSNMNKIKFNKEEDFSYFKYEIKKYKEIIRFIRDFENNFFNIDISIEKQLIWCETILHLENIIHFLENKFLKNIKKEEEIFINKEYIYNIFLLNKTINSFYYDMKKNYHKILEKNEVFLLKKHLLINKEIK